MPFVTLFVGFKESERYCKMIDVISHSRMNPEPRGIFYANLTG